MLRRHNGQGRNRAILNVFAATSSFVVALTASELAVRMLRPDLTVSVNERVLFSTYDSRLGWRNRPNAKGTFFRTHVEHSAAGQRDKLRRPTRSGAGPRILVLGDSFVWGYRVEARDRFTDRLETLLPGSEILNFGCSGYGQDQELILLRRSIRRWQPDRILVAVHVASDLENNMSSMQYGCYKPLFRVVNEQLVLTNVPVPKPSPGSRIDKWMTPRFALWNLIMNCHVGEVAVRARFVNAMNALSFSRPAKVLRSNVSRTEITCRLCSAIADLGAKNRAKTLFLLIPNVDVHSQSIQDSRDYDGLRGCLSDRKLDVFDLAPVFRAYHAEHPNGAITRANDRHWSPEGNSVVSRALYDYFQQHPPSLRMGERPDQQANAAVNGAAGSPSQGASR